MPKCLTIIKGKPILQHLLDAFCLQGIKKIIIATGYLEHHIRAYMNQYAQDIQVEYVFNPNYKTTNNIYSLWLTRQFINEAFVLVESDLIFDVNLFAPMVYPDCIALSIILPWMNGTNVSLNDDNQVEAVHMSISANQHQCYKTVNICSLSLNSWYKVLDRMDNYIFEKKLNNYYEVVFSDLVANKTLLLKAVMFDEKKWYEIDTIKDLNAAETLFSITNE